MVNDLTELMRENVAAPPVDHFDLEAVMRAGRRRVRGRRAVAAGATVVVAGVLAGTAALVLPNAADDPGVATRPPAPDAPTLSLADARPASEGRDYRVLASHTNRNLDSDNGQYLDGLTDDGLILFRDGPRADQLNPRFALMDPATGEKDWLPHLGVGQATMSPVELGADRLVLLSTRSGSTGSLTAHVFDRATRQWSSIQWPGLPDTEDAGAILGPDGRLYVRVPATQGHPPKGGWPTGPDGEAEDAGARGDTYALWSVSMTDPGDVRNEHLTIGDVAFTPTSMVWTDSTNGAAGRVHVRDLATGDEHSFDPRTGKRCNLLAFGATSDRVVLSQYCGTYDGGVRDDRVQVLTTDGTQVVTIQDSGIDGALTGRSGTGGVVVVTAYEKGRAGTYLYDLGTDRLLRVSDAVSHWALGGTTPDGQFFWDTPVNGGHGSTQWLGQLTSGARP